MSLGGFQLALADMVGSEALCRAIRANPIGALSRYDLTNRERRRLAAVVWQRGMSATLTVQRSTRLTPLYTMLPLTIGLLGPLLREVVDAYWAEASRLEVRFDLEARRFADYLVPRLRGGLVVTSHEGARVADLLEIEVALETARLGIPVVPPPGAAWRLAPGLRLVLLSYAPLLLLEGATRSPPDVSAAPTGRFTLLVEIAEPAPRLLAPPESWTDALLALGKGDPPAELRQSGLVVPVG